MGRIDFDEVDGCLTPLLCYAIIIVFVLMILLNIAKLFK